MATRDDEHMAMTRQQHRAIFDTNTTATAGPNRAPVCHEDVDQFRKSMHHADEAVRRSQHHQGMAESVRLYGDAIPKAPNASPVTHCCSELAQAVQVQEKLLVDLLERLRPVLRQSPVDDIEQATPPSYGAALPDTLQLMATQLVRQNQCLQALMDRLAL